MAEEVLIFQIFCFALGRLRIHHGLGFGTGDKLGHRRCRNPQGCAGSRILAGACGTLRRLKGTEADQLHSIAFLHDILNGLEQRFEYNMVAVLDRAFLVAR